MVRKKASRRARRTSRSKAAKQRLVRLFLQGVGLALVLAGAYWLARLAQGSEAVRMTVASYGYVGVFAVAFISGLNLVVPVPGIAFVPVFVKSGLDFNYSIIVLTAGMTIADSVAYGFGALGRKVYAYTHQNGRTIRALIRFRKHHRLGPYLALLVFAMFAPLPNEVMVIPMGILGYRLRHILPVIFVGNFVFNQLYAQGIARLFDLM